MKRLMVAVLALTVPCAALAQEAKPQEQKPQEATVPELDTLAEEEEPAARQHIQVLNDPHEISSFYRSDAGPRYHYVEPGYNAPLVYERPHESSGWTTYGRGGHVSPYELSSYYRSEPAAHPATIVMPRGGSCGR